jgi:(p)ppGpp synthase/HD superfamily hydrolase
MLERAIAFAARAHEGQFDRIGAPYVLHPLRVMLRLDEPTDMTAAALHDVVEDCGVTLDDLRVQGFPEEVVAVVDALTRRAGETYEAHIRRAGATERSRRIKLADLADNLERSSLLPLTDDNVARIARYRKATEELQTHDEETRSV